jgi:hypothetical protein
MHDDKKTRASFSRDAIASMVRAHSDDHEISVIIQRSGRVRTGVTILERRVVVGGGVAKDQFMARAIDTVLPVADHFLPGRSGVQVTVRPLARLRRDCSAAEAKAAEIRGMVDHRAPSRPFSIRESGRGTRRTAL